MNKQLIKRIAATGSAVALLAPLAALAQVTTSDTNLATSFGLGTGTNVRQAIINIVKFLLTFLGLIAVIIILYGGFQWMTAAGNEEKITSAKGTIWASVIGLFIILSAYAISRFVLVRLYEATTNTRMFL